MILSYNEREALEKLLPLTPLEMFDRVIAIDGGSTDGTLELYRDRQIECSIQEKKGRGNAFILAQELVSTEHVIFFSADGNEDPRDLPRMIRLLHEGHDLVIAGRYFLPGSRTDMSDDPFGLRKIGAISFGLLVRLFWRSGVFDSTNGYRGFKVQSMKKLGLDAEGHDIEFQTTIRATKLKMKVSEFPTKELERMGGTRKATAGTWSLGWVTLCCLLRELIIGKRFVHQSARKQ